MLVVSRGIKINDTMKSIEKDNFRSSQKVGWEGVSEDTDCFNLEGCELSSEDDDDKRHHQRGREENTQAKVLRQSRRDGGRCARESR